MPSSDDLRARLRSIDGRGYGAYKDLKGRWDGRRVSLCLDRIQGDPFAAPSKARLLVQGHGLPEDLASTRVRRAALCDALLDAFAEAVEALPRVGGSGKSGRVLVDAGGAEILERTGCALEGDVLELRFRVGLPAKGRRVLGRAASQLLCELLPRASERVRWEHVDQAAVREHVELAEDHALLQAELEARGLVAFVRDGSILPRESGVSPHPLPGAVPFESPPSLRVTLPTKHHGEVTGMGLPEGVTVITGGGFHGKTTLLEALEAGVYPHVAGDGREWVVTRSSAVKVRSEDGRSIAGVDLRPFVRDLPGGRDTAAFSTPDASGSTSLAAAILEALEVGASALLLDEDTCATNLLVADPRMRELVKKEPLTPLVAHVRALHEVHGVSTLLVTGASSEYLAVADRVLLLEDCVPREVTEEARALAGAKPAAGEPLALTPRTIQPRSIDSRRGRRERVRGRGLRELELGEERVDLGAIDQLADPSQVRAIGPILLALRKHAEGATLREALEATMAEVEARGLFALDPSPDLALPRPFEVAAALNRLRSLRTG